MCPSSLRTEQSDQRALVSTVCIPVLVTRKQGYGKDIKSRAVTETRAGRFRLVIFAGGFLRLFVESRSDAKCRAPNLQHMFKTTPYALFCALGELLIIFPGLMYNITLQ